MEKLGMNTPHLYGTSLLTSAIHACHDGIVMTQRDGRIGFVNPAFALKVRREAESLLGQPFSDLLDLEQNPPTAPHDFGECENLLFMRRSDGSLFPAGIRVSEIPAEQNSENTFVIIVRDLSHRLQVEMDLRGALNHMKSMHREQLRLQDALNRHAACLVTDRDNVIVETNERFSVLLGYAPREIIGQPLGFLDKLEAPHSLLRKVKKANQQGEPWTGRLGLLTKQSESIWVDATVSPYNSHQGLLEKTVMLFTDVTRWKRIQGRFLEKER